MQPSDLDPDRLRNLTDSQFEECYTITQPIGVGGSGDVHSAVQRSLSRRVVIKVIRQEVTGDDTTLLRFEREARVLSRLVHPRIVRVFDHGLWEGRPFLVLEYVDGGSLAAHVRKSALQTDGIVRLMQQVAEGLAYLHDQGVLHRDIKPANILLTRSLEAKISDFGLARSEGSATLTEEGMVVGTLRYLAPETLTTGDFDVRSDLYSLGVTFYQLLARTLPFPDNFSRVEDLIGAQVNTPPTPIERHRPDLVPELCTLVNRLVCAEPAGRPASAQAVNRILEDLCLRPGALDGYDREALETDPTRLRSRPGDSSLVDPGSTSVPGLAGSDAGSASGIRAAGRGLLGFLLVCGILVGGSAGYLVLGRDQGTAIVEKSVVPGVTDVRVRFATDRPSLASVVVRIPDRPERRLFPEETPGTRHDILVDGLPEGSPVQLVIRFTDGSRPAVLDTRTLEVGAGPLEVRRDQDRIVVKLGTRVPVRLRARVASSRSGPAPVASPRLLGETPRGVHHLLSMGPVSPRENHRIQATLVLPDDREHPFPPVDLESTLLRLQRLATDVDRENLAHKLHILQLHRKDRPAESPAEPSIRYLESLDYRARSRALLEAIGPDLSILDLTFHEARTLYGQLQGLRHADRYFTAWNLSYRTQVERLVPSSFRYGPDDLLPGSEIVARHVFPDGTIVGPSDAESQAFLDIVSRTPTPRQLAFQLVPEVRPRSPVVQFRIRLDRFGFGGFSLEIAGSGLQLVVIPPLERIFDPGPLTLYHAMPTEFLPHGPIPVTLRMIEVAGTHDNPISKRRKLSYTNWEENFPHILDVSLMSR